MKVSDDVQPSCRAHFTLHLIKICGKADDRTDVPEEVDGAPCALQVIAPRFLDEKCLAAAAVMDRDIRMSKC